MTPCGRVKQVLQCTGARDSFREAMRHILERHKHDAIAQLQANINQLETKGSLRSPDKFNFEGSLPNDQKYYAIKTTQGLRAYGWFEGSIYWISHFAYKDSKKRKNVDNERVLHNWRLKQQEKHNA